MAKKMAKSAKPADIENEINEGAEVANSQSKEEILIDQELGALLGLSKDVPGEELQEELNEPSEANEEPLKEDSEEQKKEDENGEENEAEEADETLQEIKPFEDRLAEFEQEFNPVQEKTLRAELKEFESALETKAQALANPAFVQNLPKGGIFESRGKSVFEMPSNELNDYLVDLRDNGQEFAAGQVQTAYFNAVEEAKKYSRDLETFQQDKTRFENARNYVEWTEFKEKIQGFFPEITKEDFDKAAAFIDQSASNDPGYFASVQTAKGKAEKGVEALDKLGILKRLKEKANPNQKPKTPSAPDARAVSKKVNTKVTNGKPTYKYSDIEKMPQKDFNKLPDDMIDSFLKGENLIFD